MSPLFRLHVPALCLALIGGSVGSAQVPTYRVDSIDTFSVSTTLRGANEVGQFVGSRASVGLVKPWVASLETGLLELPLPAGYTTGAALDVNDAGVIVGTVSDTSFPFDLGDAVAWIPDGSGGYSTQILDVPATIFAAGRDRPTDGGLAVAINNVGDIAIKARLQGFQAGQPVVTTLANNPIDLGPLGYTATVADINDQRVVVGGGKRIDLNTNTVTDLGLPDDAAGISVNFVESFVVNNNGQTIAAANRATAGPDQWQTFAHTDADGWIAHNPAVITPFVGFYDNNDLNDIAATGGVRFDAENTLVLDLNDLLEASDANWSVGLGFIDNTRRFLTTAIDTTDGSNHVVLLTPLTFGDATVDDLVNVDDLLQIAPSYGGSDTRWATGDFDRNTITDFNDLLLMAESYADDTPLDGLGLDPGFLDDWALAQAAVAELVGDYNADGVVNAADYTVWRDNLGQSGDGLAADGNRDGVIDQLDYDLWRQNFGQGSSGAPGRVPEPASVVLALLGALTVLGHIKLGRTLG